MKKYLHMAGEAAGKLLAAAAKLAKRLAYTVMRTVGAAAATTPRWPGWPSKRDWWTC